MNRPPRYLSFFCAFLLGALILPALSQAAPTEVLRYHGDGSSATGAALGNAEQCDVNGDGYDDAVVGAWFWDKAPLSNIGAAYVILGSEAPRGASLNNPSAANAVRIDGPSVANAFVGFAVGCLGDVNGDGNDDIGISHYTAQKAYVVFGDRDFSAVDLGLLGSRGFEVRGDATSGNVGFSLAPVGDLDGDGLDEFGVAEVVADTQGRTNNGRIWVISGQDDIADVDLINPASGQIRLTVDGAYAEERLGVLSEVGDVNGDGKDDFLVGSYTAVPWGSSVAVPGSAAVIWGGSIGEVDLANLGNRGFRIFGPTRGRDRLGISVSGAGDLNADGKADLIVGADGVYNAATGDRNGSAWVIFGSESNATVYTAAPENDTIPAGSSDVTAFTCENDPGTGACSSPEDVRPRGYRIAGAVNRDSTAYSVAGIGDVSGDGVPDLAIGAYGYDPVDPESSPATMSGAGAVWVVYGKADTSNQQLVNLSESEGFRIDGLAAGDRMGRQVGAFGDFDGNGVRDFFAGGDFASRPLAPETPLSQAGEVIVGLNGALATETQVLVDPAGTSALGQQFELTASSSRLAGSAAAVDGGSYSFTLDGELVPGCEDVPVDAGTASCEVTPDTRGEHEFGAEYSGVDGAHLGSSGTSEVVHLNDTTATTLVSSASEVTIGRPVTLTASVSPDHGGTPVSAGSVAFTVGGEQVEPCAAVPVDEGEATCTTHIDSVGVQQLGATYSGSTDLVGSSAPEISQTVFAAPASSVAFSRGSSPTVGFGDPVTLTAAVSSAGEPADQGTVDFLADGQPIPSCQQVALISGTATCVTSLEKRGRISLSARYGGSISIQGSTSGADNIDVIDTSSLMVSADRTSVRVGEAVTVASAVEATHGGDVSEGFVELVADGCEGCGRQTVAAGSTSHRISFSVPGTYTVNAAFAGAEGLSGSTADPLIISVTKLPACAAVRPTAGKPQFSARGRVLTFRIASGRKADAQLSPKIRFRKNGKVRTINLAGRQIRTGEAKTVRFRLSATQARRLPARVAVTVKVRARPLATDCVASFGPTFSRNLGQARTGKGR